MSRFKTVISVFAAFAFLAFMAGGVEAQLAGKKLLVDLSIQSGAAADKVNDGRTSMRPSVKTGDTLRVELFVEGAAGASIIGYELKFFNENNAFQDKWTISGVEAIGSLAVLGSPGEDSVAPGGLAPSTVPANGYIGTLILIAKADVAEGDSIVFIDTSVGLADFTQPELDESEAVIRFQTPAKPRVQVPAGTSTDAQGNVLAPAIPATGDTRTSTITITVPDFEAGATITYSINADDPARLKVLISGTEQTLDNMMLGTTETSLDLQASGPGDLLVTVFAYVGTDTSETITVLFTQANPAELASFGGELVDDRVVLNWTTVSQTNNAGWRMLRSLDGENYEAVSEFIQGAGTSDALLNYSFEDANLPNAEKVYYVLEQVDLDGSVTRSGAIEVILGARLQPLPTEFAINVYPNPFNPSTTISYDLPDDALVSIVIYDAIGQEVRRLTSKQALAGRYQIQWDARDNQGRSVGSGVYIAKVKAGSFSLSQKMLLLK